MAEDQPGLHDAWAKLEGNGAPLPLADHGADVAAVLQRLVAEPAWLARLEHCAGRALAARDLSRLAALSALHDLGKANRGFWAQGSSRQRVGHTHETAALFYAKRIAAQPAAVRLRAIIQAWGAADLFRAVMAHHGRPLDAYASEQGRDMRRQVESNKVPAAYWLPEGGYDPLAQLDRLLDAATARFPDAFADGPVLPGAAAFVSLFCGLLTLADWLGSDTSLFPVSGPHGREREELRRGAANQAVAGRSLAALATPPCTFAAAFGVDSPRGLQRLADSPGLGTVALMEAETGSGKTEAALWRWLALRRAGMVDGLYFALPTRSAAVQLHGRVNAVLGRVFGPGVAEAVLAVPGYIRAGEAEGQALPDFGTLWSDDGAGDGRWAAERPKRFLAARVAVGTIDQVLMAGLQLRHAHLRAAVLSRSLLVVDEVHASDAFMGEILGHVLRNHDAVGGHALLLSATLTDEMRARLLGRCPAASVQAAVDVPYPALSSSASDPASPGVADVTGKAVLLEAWPAIDDPAAIAARAVEAARAGASVLVVRNSVAGAVAVAQAVDAAAPDLAFRVAGVSTLHHGRFGPGDRRLLDAAVEAAFGKTRDTRGRVLCGTQTLEQSLDLDADLLITDLAPIDVLLQRIGRLHRHAGRDRGAFGTARAVVLVPPGRDLSAYLGPVQARHGLGPVRYGQGVYPDLVVLEATLRQIEQNPVISIPRDNRRLVEGALHPNVLSGLEQELRTAWMNHANAQDGTMIAERGLARRWALDLSASFGTLLFPSKDEAVATRLGTRDRLVDFDPPFAGPFGQVVERLSMPGWMAGDVAPDTAPVLEGADVYGARFRLEEKRFLYGQWGLEAVSTSCILPTTCRQGAAARRRRV